MPGSSKTDEYCFDIQLDTVAQDRGFHSRNKPGQLQRANIVDDICNGLLVQARIDRVVHGTRTRGGDPATLIVFGFRFHGIGKRRRFREVAITVVFQDKEKEEDSDPIVASLWPNGDFTLGERTDINTENKQGGEVTGNVGAPYGGGSTRWFWERSKGYVKTDRASLTGSVMLDMSVRDSGPPNAVILTLSENETVNSGLVSDFRAAVLLFRQSDADQFTAKVKINATADFRYNLVKGMREIIGQSPANDPIHFMPSPEHQYTRTATLGPYLEDKLAEQVDESNLSASVLPRLAGVLGATTLADDGSE